MRQRKGFTLIEVIVVLAILGLLVMLGMPKYKSYVREAELTRLKVECRELGEASMKYYMGKGDWPRQSEVPYSVEEVKAFGSRIVDETGLVVGLEEGGKYYDIDYTKLGDYISKPNKGYNYVLQNPVGRVYGIEKATEERKKEYKGEQVEVKPIASISMSPEDGILPGTLITWKAGVNKGELVEEEWIGRQESYATEGVYVVKLRVQDEKGIWSDWVEKEVQVLQYVSKVGHALTGVEQGWQRIDNTDKKIVFIGSWYKQGGYSLTAFEKGTIDWTLSGVTNTISFKFKGTKLRYYTNTNNSGTRSLEISIDGIPAYFDLWDSRGTTGSIQQSVLIYEKQGLSNKEHTVSIGGGATAYGCAGFDAIDIDELGYLIG